MTPIIPRSARAAAIVLLALVPAAGAQTTAAPAIRTASAEVFQAIRSIYDYNRAAPLEVESVSKQDFPAYTREKLVFTSVVRTRVPALLLIPKEGKAPFPVVILLHGITGYKEGWFDPDGWAYGPRLIDPLIAAGVAVLALDARYHGERGAESGYRIPTALEDIRDLVIQTVIEQRRAMDVLATRPNIDSTRVGVLGLSMGGMETFILTGVDRRVKVAVAGVTPVGVLKDPKTIAVAPQTFSGAIRTTPILMLMGRSDDYYTVDDARRLFETIASPAKDLVFYDSGHRMPAAYAEKAVAWLLQYLK